MRRILGFLAVALLAGCAAPAPTDDVVLDEPAAGNFLPTAAAAWLDLPDVDGVHVAQQWMDALDCSVACPEVAFDATVPEDGWVEVTLQWDGTRSPGTGLWVTDPTGEVHEAVMGFDGARVQIFDAPSGAYTVDLSGGNRADIRVQVKELGLPLTTTNQALPDLITLRIEPILLSACMPDEMVEDGARRCLRLGNAVGNMGEAPLQAMLSTADGALAVAGAGNLQQRIWLRDGAHEDVDMGPAEFHAVHGHFHVRGLAEFELYAFDAETGLRGEAVAAGHKAGFCLVDWGQMYARDAPSAQGTHAEQDCLVPNTEGWAMGVSAGWYDYYGPGLSDQYIDIEGLPDGTYELVSTANPAGLLHEVTPDNNRASAVIRLEGNHVEVLEHRAFYAVE